MSEITTRAASEGVFEITLNRPEKRNAMNDALISAIEDAVSEAGRNKDCRAIVIRGAGKDFCSGADLSALQKIADSDILENLRDADLLADLFVTIRHCRVPVIAAVHGRALAGGCGLATACDIVLASESARFGYPEVKIGFVPAMVMAILRRNLSEKAAFEIATRGFDFSAAEARDFGLVNRVFSDEQFDIEVAAFASEYAKLSASAVELTKRLLYEMDGMDFRTALRSGADVNAIARTTKDCRDGIARFLDKR